MRAAEKCRGSGVEVARHFAGAGARWTRTWTCDVCGRRVELTARGRLPAHRPVRRAEAGAIDRAVLDHLLGE